MIITTKLLWLIRVTPKVTLKLLNLFCTPEAAQNRLSALP